MSEISERMRVVRDGRTTRVGFGWGSIEVDFELRDGRPHEFSRIDYSKRITEGRIILPGWVLKHMYARAAKILNEGSPRKPKQLELPLGV